MSDSEPWTIGRLLKWTTDFLKSHGSDSARLDAEVLLAHARGCQRIELYTCFDELASQDLKDQYRALVRKRSQGHPVAHLVGHREFYSRDFHVSPAVLTPRPETEFVLVALFDRFSKTAEPARVLDLGTGSGALAICAALDRPQAIVKAVDISAEALEVAAMNVAKHQVESQVTLVISDLFEAIADDEKFDFIVSNPPYIGESERQDLPRDVIENEPAVALFSGPDGLDLFRRIAIEAIPHLSPGGWLICEFSPPQLPMLKDLFSADPAWSSLTVIEDLSRQPRVFAVQRLEPT